MFSRYNEYLKEVCIMRITKLLSLNKVTISLLGSFLLTGCANFPQFHNEDEVTTEMLQSQLEQQNQQILKLSQQQSAILATLKKQPDLFAQHQTTISRLDQKLDTLVMSTNDLTARTKRNEDKAHARTISEVSDITDQKPPVKPVVGAEEWLWLDKLQASFKARVDTGAATSSLNALNMVEFERDGEKWVKFSLSHLEDDAQQEIEAKIVRTILIRQSSASESVRRPIIKLAVQLGDITTSTEFTLADRSHMTFPVLLGRTFLRDIVVVDVSEKYTQKKR